MNRLLYRFAFSSLLLIASVMLSVTSCKSKNNSRNEDENVILEKENAFFAAVSDTTVSVQDVLELAIPYAEYLSPIAAYYEVRAGRLAAQEVAAVALEHVADDLAPRIRSNDDRLAYEQIVRAFSSIRNQWLTGKLDDDDKNLHVAREISFCSYQGTGQEKQDFFYIDCLIPSAEQPNSQLVIRFPEAAQSEPCLLFYQYLTDDGKLSDVQAGYTLGEFSYLDMGEAPHSKVCFCNEEVLALMLQYDAMIIMYTSNLPATDSYNGHDSVLVGLEGFHAAYKSIETTQE